MRAVRRTAHGPVARLGLALWCAFALCSAPTIAQDRLPIVDAHVHYSRDAWPLFPPDLALDILDAAGVPRALVSSTPDDGTLMLERADPDRVVPFLRPYRSSGELGSWYDDPTVLAYLEERLASGAYRGIGEFHLSDESSAATPVMRRIVALALERDIMLHVHSGAAPIRALLALEPRLELLWAHAGMSEPPEVVGALLDRHDRLWTELSFRASDVAPGGALDPAWHELLVRHRDRFMIGSDTYLASRWGEYGHLIDAHRAWLAQLPREVALAIAYKNAVRLFGAGGRRELQD